MKAVQEFKDYLNTKPSISDAIHRFRVLLKDNEKSYDESVVILRSLLLEDMKSASGLNTIVPKEYRDKVWEFAVDEYSNSEDYVFYCSLKRLVQIFKKC